MSTLGYIMNTDRQNPNPYPFALPTLSAEAIVEIRHFIEHVLDQFDIHYPTPVRRFYEDRAEHNMVGPTPQTDDDPPF